MATPSARVNIDIQASDILSAGILAGVIPARFQIAQDLTSGTTDGSIDLVYAKTESGIAASTITSYDLAGSLKSPTGDGVVFAEVCLIAVRNKRTTALAYLEVGPHGTNGFGGLNNSKGFWKSGDSSVVGPDSWYVVYDKVGVPVTAGTADILAITTSSAVGSTNTWDVLVLGRSA